MTAETTRPGETAQAMPRAGTPIWADAMFADLEGAKRFYGEVLGWTFGAASTEYGDYTEAYADGKAAAAVVPPMPGAEDTAAWCLYLASPDAAATAEKIRENGGQVLMEPMQVSDFGTMVLARDPSGTVFGVWQPGRHRGFEARPPAPGAYCWAEVTTRDPDRADAFFGAVFGYRQQVMQDPGEPDQDFRLYNLGDTTVLGRLAMHPKDFPADAPPFVNVYFTVDDADRAASRTRELGGQVHWGPESSPYGRFAVLADPAGAVFSVLDTETTSGQPPTIEDAG
ncbi:VOC family protein [Streptomyces sp. ODS05-4]|uniref:VOC family protein n=1 Tax=Streptomyces sp. ODS05-4 TaxID=2944939 RepID=UPI0035AEB2BC